MLTVFRTALACATLTAVLVPLSASAADDAAAMAPAMSMDKVPCSQAAMMMSGGMHAMHGGAMKGDAMKDDAMKGGTMTVDAAFAEMAESQMGKIKHMMGMAKLEMRCGTDAKTKAAAEKTYDDLQQLVTTLNIF